MNLIHLHRFTGKSEFEDKASHMIVTFSQVIKTAPTVHTQFLSGLDFYLSPSKEIILIGNEDEKIKGYLKILRENFIPNKVILYKNSKFADSLARITEYTESYPVTDGTIAVYLCENLSCKSPIASEVDLLKELDSEQFITKSKKRKKYLFYLFVKT